MRWRTNILDDADAGNLNWVVVFLASRVVGVSPDRGALLWEFFWLQGDNIAAQPLAVGDNRVFVSDGSGGALIEVARDGERLIPREVWRTHRMKNAISSSVLHDGFIYGLDLGILACIDAASGDLKWKGGRYGDGQVLLASGQLEVARVPAIEGRTWNHPAIADGFLLVRNGEQMAAFDLRVR